LVAEWAGFVRHKASFMSAKHLPGLPGEAGLDITAALDADSCTC